MAEKKDCEGILCDLEGTPKKCKGTKLFGACVGQLAERFFLWTPRILGMGIALIAFVLAFGVFIEENWTLTRMLVVFLFQLIPFFVVLAILLIAWRWELIGGIIYIALGIGIIIYMIIFRFQIWYFSFIISVPLFFIGFSFIIYWFLTEITKDVFTTI